jgi:hypothetical protein
VELCPGGDGIHLAQVGVVRCASLRVNAALRPANGQGAANVVGVQRMIAAMGGVS